MSFSISFTGDDREDALAKLAEAVDETKLQGGNIPDDVPGLVESVISSLPDTGGKVSVSANGHYGSETDTSNISISVSNQLAVSQDPAAGIKDAVPSAE